MERVSKKVPLQKNTVIWAGSRPRWIYAEYLDKLRVEDESEDIEMYVLVILI